MTDIRDFIIKQIHCSNENLSSEADESKNKIIKSTSEPPNILMSKSTIQNILGQVFGPRRRRIFHG